MDLELLVSDRLAAKLREARSILDEACTYFDPSHMFGMFSGGHDSRVALEVARTHPYFSGAAHINTTIGIERTRQYVRDTCADLDIVLKEYRAPVSYREIVLQHGFPGPGGHFFMYTRLKERAVRQLVREHKRDKDDYVLLVTGVRLSESKRRMGHVKPIQREGRRVWVAPILNFDNDDKQELMQVARIARNPVVDELCMSGECLCGAFASPGELAEIEIVDPAAYFEIKALQQEVAAAGKHAVWGTRPPGTRSPKKPPKSGAMCHSCAAKNEDAFDYESLA